MESSTRGRCKDSGPHRRGVNLEDAKLTRAILHGADLSFATLSGANLFSAVLVRAVLHRSTLSHADLRFAILSGANLFGANFADVVLKGTIFAFNNLTEVKGLDKVIHTGPSAIDVHTLIASQGQIPDSFLNGCGFPPWQVL